MTLFDNAEYYHNSIDESYNTSNAFDTNTNGVKTYLIAGSGKPTIGQIHDYYGFTTIWSNRMELPFGSIKLDADAVNGDDTVPTFSATLGKLVNVYYVNQEHKNLPSGTALQLAYNILNGQSTNIPGVYLAPVPFYGKIISVHSPVLLSAFDRQGNHTGPKDDGVVEVGIPSSSYDELGESKFIYLPDGDSYNIKTKATSNDSFDLKIKTYTESSLSKEQIYLSVPQTDSTTTTLTLNSDNPVLQVDTENDGIVDYNLNPSSTISGDALADAKPPETAVQVGGTEGTNGWYKSNVTLSFNVDDTGAGLLKTYYYKDGEQILHETEPNTIIDSEGTTKLWYFSVDKAGNTENPKNTTIKIDKTIPDVEISTPQDNAVYLLNSPLTANWQATDNLSGIDSQNGTVASGEAVDTSQVGAHTFEVTAVDNAGNSKTQTITYKVIYRFDGFLQPINDTGHEQACGTPCTLSIFKSGSTVPVKLQLKDALGNLVRNRPVIPALCG